MGVLRTDEASHREKALPKALPDAEGLGETSPPGGVLQLDRYFAPDMTDDTDETPDVETLASHDADKKLKNLKKELKKLTDRVASLEDAAESVLPECDDPVGALLARFAMKEKKRTLKMVYGIVKEYAGSDNADPGRIPGLFRELFELCVTGNVTKY